MKKTLATAVIGLSLLLGACGTGAADTVESDPQGPDAEAIAVAEEAGTKAAEEAGEPTELNVGKIALLQISGVSESSQRLEESFRSAASVVGMDDIAYCDAEGDATKMSNCFNTLLAQKPEAIFVLCVEPAIISGGIARARAAGIPVFNFGGATAPSEDVAADEFDGSYFPDDRVVSTTLSDYMIEDLGGKGKIGLFTFPASLALKTRQDVLVEKLADTDIEVVEDHVTDFANPIEDVRKATVAMLTAHPDLDAIWFSTDFNGPAIQQGITQVNPANKPKVYGFWGNPSNLAAIKSGTIRAVPDDFLEWNSYVVIDQAIELLARGVKPSRDARPEYELEGFMEPILIDADNVPSNGKVIPNPVDYVTFFETKWKTEFTNLK